MKRDALTLLAAAAIGLTASAASAADLPRKAPAYHPPPPPPPIYNWTGFYLGGHFGAGWSRNELSEGPFLGDSADFGFNPGTNFGSHNGLGPLGGFQVGYNWQFANSPIVIGIEGEYSFANLKGDNSHATSFADSFVDCGVACLFGTTGFEQTNFAERISTEVKDIATIAARLGVASGPQDRTLWYVKGGGAWAKTHFAEQFDYSDLGCSQGFILVLGGAVNCDATNATGAASGDHSRWGWLVGAGVEWGLWQNWSAKIEYDYMNFGSYDISLSGTAQGTTNGAPFNSNFQRSLHVDQQIHAVKVGLNYRFDWGR
jgi:outer membrane immunogenic protein